MEACNHMGNCFLSHNKMFPLLKSFVNGVNFLIIDGVSMNHVRKCLIVRLPDAHGE